MDYNTVIIGSGVAGMTAAIYLARANLSVCILEKEIPGGQITRTSEIDNYPGFLKIEGPELATNMYQQVMNLKVPYYYTEGLEIESISDRKIVKTKGKTITCKNIIIATGRSPRKLGLEKEEKLTGRGISFCAICDGGLYKGKEVAVIGGGKSALEETLYLSKICSKVTLIHRRDDFRAEEELIDEVKAQSNIEVLTNKQVVAFTEEQDRLSAIQIQENDDIETIPVEGCFEYIGQIPNTKNFQNLDILDSDGYIEVDKDYETKISGIYAIGDCIKKDLYQIVTACSDGAVVASTITKKLENRR